MPAQETASWQSWMFSQILSRTLRPLTHHVPVDRRTLPVARLVIERAALGSGRLPRGTTVEHVALGNCAAELVRAPGTGDGERILVYFHGGGFVAGSARAWRPLVAALSATSGLPVLSVDYRLVPEHALADAVADGTDAYRWLLARGHGGDDIVLAGDSAGGGLAFLVALRLRDEGLPGPGRIAAFSPWVDFAASGESHRFNRSHDPYLSAACVGAVTELCVAGREPELAELSPLYADLRGLPPVLLLVGGKELLRSDGELMARRLTEAAVPCELQVWPGQMHAFPLLRLLPESAAALGELARFATASLP
ncbi:alpha/beta hydrolase [Amycolatopsis cynarae]|uniref:Alpha/beta hydrolase n=1 Tax=Amycolatopsis cynarae TaxID=2995223 RepID=A0ABY7B7Q0_9PSEU|nr:alpha/beta hydrolase [Amycolatopsis sp. HUAS 11-8]WAL68372.1 alpha/beta hydrolase [Amycolatopsis sp. HUAS 11-8]